MNTKVILDTDPGIDDAIALLYLHAIPTLELHGITTVFGNASVNQCTQNALYICQTFGIPVPVAAGANVTVTGRVETEYPLLAHGANGLGNIDIPALQTIAVDQDAVTMIAEIVRAHPDEITLIAVGRLTNVAQFIQKYPRLAQQLKTIVIMGGACQVPGNVTQFAEANIIGDPEAAARVFASGLPLTMVGLDVTMLTQISSQEIKALCHGLGKVGQFIYSILRHYINYYATRYGTPTLPIHDACAVACVACPALFSYEQGDLHCVLEGERRGYTAFTPNLQGVHRVCVSVDSENLFKHFQAVMAARYRESL